MKPILKVILIGEALMCLLIVLIGEALTDVLPSLFAFPFEQLGIGLRFLSTSGTMGNIISLILYCTICLLPSAYAALRAYKNCASTEDWLLALLSALLFPVLYLMVNPAYIERHFGVAELIEINKALLGLTIYSILAGYIVLRGLRLIHNRESKTVLKHLKILLIIICLVLVFGIFGSGFCILLSSLQQLAAENTGSGPLFLSQLFLVLQYLINILPLALQIAITFSGIELIHALERDPYGEDVPNAARKTGSICRKSITAIMLSQISINIMQFALGSQVRSSHYTLSVPLLSVVLVLAVMLLVGYFEQARRYKEDNELFI